MRKAMKRMTIIVMSLIVMLGTLAIMTACEGSRTFTNAEHIERISERVQERFIDGTDYPYTDFSVTILYNTHAEEPQFFMIEFMPDGFFYGVIHRNRYYMNTMNFVRGSHWRNGETTEGTGQGGWDFWNEEKEVYERVFRSHFYVFGITSERKYLHGTHKFGGLGPVIRVADNNFLCLLEGRTFQGGGVAPTGVFNPAGSSNRGDRI